MISVYQHKGATTRCTIGEVQHARKSIIASTTEADKGSRSGYELEKSVFLEKYKDQPEILKQARWFSVRERDETGNWKVEQHTKVYDDKKGVYRFEESHTESPASNHMHLACDNHMHPH